MIWPKVETVISRVLRNQVQLFDAIDSLVAKSMVATRPIGAMVRFLVLYETLAPTGYPA